MKLSLVFLAILLLSALSLSKNQLNSATPAPEEIDDAVLHGESSQRLITIMERFYSLIHEEGIEEATVLTQDDMTDLIENVEELLFYAELMSGKIPSNELEENETVIFSAMVSQLYNETLNIQQLANNYELGAIDSAQNRLMSDAFERLNRTCAACHQLFRDN
jgi:hypothetical protein